jgi:hypothetical protein
VCREHMICPLPVAGDVDMDEFAAIVAEDDEGKEQEGRDHKEPDGADLVLMGLQEGTPGWGGPR